MLQLSEVDEQSGGEKKQSAEDRLELKHVPEFRVAERDTSHAESRTDKHGQLRTGEPHQGEGEHAYHRKRYQEPDHNCFQPAPGGGAERQTCDMVSK